MNIIRDAKKSITMLLLGGDINTKRTISLENLTHLHFLQKQNKTFTNEKNTFSREISSNSKLGTKNRQHPRKQNSKSEKQFHPRNKAKNKSKTKPLFNLKMMVPQRRNSNFSFYQTLKTILLL